jgi:hypothetical protein
MTSSWSSSWPGRRALAGLVILVVWIGWMVVHQLSDRQTVSMLAGLPRNGVVAAEVGGTQAGGDWLVTSGTLFTRDGDLWSGRPDEGPPDPAAGRTGSAVLRAVSVRSDFTNVLTHVELRSDGLTSTRRTPEQSWDGVHLFLHYRDANNLYAVDLVRRDGSLSIKRKSTAKLETTPVASATAAPDSTGQDDGVYQTLANTRLTLTRGLHTFDASIKDLPGGVQIALVIDGQQVLSTLDDQSVALNGPGRVGLRGDNAEFTVREFDVRMQR